MFFEVTLYEYNVSTILSPIAGGGPEKGFDTVSQTDLTRSLVPLVVQVINQICDPQKINNTINLAR